ncbi:MAG: carbon storage regulator CsrA [Myxococcota bacterium]
MLVLSRKNGEALRIGSRIRLQVVAAQGGQVRLAIDAPDDVVIHREEVYQRIAQANREAMKNDPQKLTALAQLDVGGGRDEEERR